MTTGVRVIIAAAAVGLGLYLISRASSGQTVSPVPAPAPPGPSSPGFTVPSTFTDFGPVVPQLGPIYSALKPIADNVTTPLINDLNKAVGGVNPYAGLSNVKQNADGSFTGTDGTGCTVTLYKNGTIKRDCGSLGSQWQRSNVHAALVSVGHAASGAVHFVEGLF